MMIIHYMDVKRVYLNAPLDYEIYVDLLEGFKGKNGIMLGNLKDPYIG